MNKYYTPEIEEFHIGFEYEWLDENGNWNKESTPTKISKEGYEDQLYGLRVKYLDREDIESLGFKMYKQHAGLTLMEFESNDSRHNITFDANFGEKWNITIADKFDFIYFHGFIKNKSELKKLLSQLSITNKQKGWK